MSCIGRGIHQGYDAKIKRPFVSFMSNLYLVEVQKFLIIEASNKYFMSGKRNQIYIDIRIYSFSLQNGLESLIDLCLRKIDFKT